MAATTPPFAVPSSLVTMRPVRPIAASNALTCARPFWPVFASSTSSTASRRAVARLARSPGGSCAAPPSGAPAWAGAPRYRRCTTSMPRARAAPIASKITAAGSPPCCWTTAMPLRSPQTTSCSRAAARNVSPAASSTDRFWLRSHFASLPIEVVLPAPLTPAIMITYGRSLRDSEWSLQRREQVGHGVAQHAARIGRRRRRGGSARAGRR